jgi:hypothetical protein
MTTPFTVLNIQENAYTQHFELCASPIFQIMNFENVLVLYLEKYGIFASYPEQVDFLQLLKCCIVVD